MTTVLEEAVNRLSRQGFAVIDIPIGTKRRTAPWKEYQTRKPTTQELRGMFGDGDRNLALVCGHSSGGLAVLDLDDTDLAGRVADDVALQAETTLVRTPRGGLHVYVIETDAISRSGPLVPSVADLKAEGGYILAPPSSINEHEYVTLTNTTIKCVPNARDWAVALLRAYDVEVPEERTEPLSIAKTIEEMTPGIRNDSIFKLACKLRRNGMDDEDIAAFCRQTGRGHGLPDREIDDIIRSVMKYPAGVDGADSEASAHLFTPRDKPDWTELSLLWAKDLEPLEASEAESLWGMFVFPASNVLVSGDSGVGKTTLLYNWAVQAARGEEFVGIPFPRKLRVLYLDLETPDNLRRTKLNVVSTSDRPEGLAFMPAIDFMEDIHKLALIVKQHSFDVVIIDTISAAFRTEREEDNAEANAQARGIRDLITLTGATVIQVQQIGKGEIAKKVYKARGASARPASADIVLNLETVDADTVKLEMAKNRWLGGNEKLFLLKAGEDQFEVAEVAGDQGVGEVIQAQDWLKNWGAARVEGARYKDIAEASPFSESTTRRALSGLVQTGQVQKPKRGYYMFFCSVNLNPKVEQMNRTQSRMDVGTSDEDGQRDRARTLWEQQGRPASLTLSEWQTVTEPERFIATANGEELAKLVAKMEETT